MAYSKCCPALLSGDSLYVLQDTDFDLLWQQPLETEIGLVQAGDTVVRRWRKLRLRC
jgi:hypothetical protein